MKGKDTTLETGEELGNADTDNRGERFTCNYLNNPDGFRNSELGKKKTKKTHLRQCCVTPGPHSIKLNPTGG